MKTLPGIVGAEKLENVIEGCTPSNLAVIESIQLIKEHESNTSNLTLGALFQSRAEVWPRFEEEMFRVVMVFEEVNDFSARCFGGVGTQVMGFQILFVGDRQLEKTNYQISDDEDDRISFSCRTIKIVSVVALPSCDG